MASKFRSRLSYLLLVGLILISDRWTKSIIHSQFEANQSIPIIDGLLNITYVRNTGVAFGIFSSTSSPLKAAILSIFTAAAAAVVIVYSIRSSEKNRLLQVSLSLILGGALGNLYDRLSYGYVIDFIEVFIGNYSWPAFNVADSAISIGVILLALEIFRETPGSA